MPKRHCLSHAAGGASCAAWQFRPRGTHRVGLFSLDFLWFFLVSRQERTLSWLFVKILPWRCNGSAWLFGKATSCIANHRQPSSIPGLRPGLQRFCPFGVFVYTLSRLIVSKLFRPFRACKNRSPHTRGCAPCYLFRPFGAIFAVRHLPIGVKPLVSSNLLILQLVLNSSDPQKGILHGARKGGNR